VDDVATHLTVRGGILVGHDGSKHADKAVRWAADWARRAGCDLHVVRTWVMASAPRPPTWEPGYVPPMVDFEKAVLVELQQDVDELLQPTDPPAQCHVLHGTPGRRLVEASEQADLLVVASRGRGGFRGLVMGSTADQVVRHARCPVVVLPAHALGLHVVRADSVHED
jgi:nucleotide-binding universal stress UspA family protein